MVAKEETLRKTYPLTIKMVVKTNTTIKPCACFVHWNFYSLSRFYQDIFCC